MKLAEDDHRRPKDHRAKVEPLVVKPFDAAMMLGGSRSTVYRLIHNGSLEAVKRGATTLVLVASIHRYIESLPAFVRGRRDDESSPNSATAVMLAAAPSADWRSGVTDHSKVQHIAEDDAERARSGLHQHLSKSTEKRATR